MLRAGDCRGAETQWKNRIRYMVQALYNEGILKKNSARGIWELA